MRYAALLMLMGCTVVDDVSDASTRDGGRRWYACETACARLAELGCPAGEPDEEGTECYDVCHELEEVLPAAFHTKCVTNADSCEAADACFEGSE